MDDNNKKIKGKELYKKFEAGINQIISELKLKRPKIKIEIYETEKIGVDYIATIETKNVFIKFHIKTETDHNDLNNFERILLSMEISDNSRPFPYHKGEWFDKGMGLLSVSKWITKVFHERNVEMQNKLNYILAGHKIKFIGDWGISTPSANLFEILIKGAICIGMGHPLWGRIPILRIRHLDDSFRTFSYIVLLENSAFIFPDFCGPDSGEGGSAYERVERIIKDGIRRNKIIVYDIDIPYDKFKKFAVKYMSIDTFNSSIPAREYNKYIKIFKKYLNKRVLMGFELNKKIEKKILEELKNKYPNTISSTELSKTLNIPINEVISYISYLKDKGLLEIVVSTFRENFVKITSEGLDQISKKSDIIRQPQINNYGVLLISENISTGEISVKVENIKNNIDQLNIDNSIKVQIIEKLNEFENEIKKQKPNKSKINQIRTWFERMKDRIPDTIFNLIIQLITKY